MKTWLFSSFALVGLLLVGLQHQQVNRLRAENATLQQASTEADQLKSDLAQSTGNEAQDVEEIDRLREENRDLLKLRGEINQLRDAKAEFQKVSAENERLQSLAKNLPRTDAKSSMQPIVVQIANLSDHGLSTPEDAVQTFYWAQHQRSADAFSRVITPKSWNKLKESRGWRFQDMDNFLSIEIVARRDVDATTVQLGIQLPNIYNPQQFTKKIVLTLVLQNGEWRVDTTGN